jgi:hypothetical protein
MTRDPFFDELDVDVDSGAEHVPAASSLNADVDDWFERAAAGRVAPASGIDSRPTELLGAAALPLDGDLVRPARERCMKLPRAETPRPHRAVTATTAAVRRRRRRGLVLLAFGGLVVVITVVVLMRPVTPVAPTGPVLARGLTGPRFVARWPRTGSGSPAHGRTSALSKPELVAAPPGGPPYASDATHVGVAQPGPRLHGGVLVPRP